MSEQLKQLKNEKTKDIEYYKSLSEEDKLKLVEEILDCKLVDDFSKNGYLPYIYNNWYGKFGISKLGTLLSKFVMKSRF